MSERYIKLNEYYVKDTVTNKKMDMTNLIYTLNLQERILNEKTELIRKLIITLHKMEK